MIPFQTLLLLLAALIALSSCAQRLPPIPGGRGAVQNSANKTNTGNLPALANEVSIENSNAKDFELHLRGPDATILSQILAVKSVANVKQGTQMKCTRLANADECMVKIGTPDGVVAEMIPADQVQKAPPEKVITLDGLFKTFLQLDQADDTNPDHSYPFRINIWNNLAKQIFDGLTCAPSTKGAVTRKAGTHLACDDDDVCIISLCV